MFCLSKGLCAPVGSMVVGSKDFIDRARKNRKMLGGGMRQAGILAAAGIIALTKMVDRLQEDHDNAKLLAVKLQELGYGVNPEEVETNMVVVDVTPTGKDVHTVEKSSNTRRTANANSPKTLRLVTHYGITSDDAIKAVEVFADIIGSDPEKNCALTCSCAKELLSCNLAYLGAWKVRGIETMSIFSERVILCYRALSILSHFGS